ncbi:hypothetical protein HPP92_025630 [Vanilla planifolia]|uniref:Uncharacterized protein n=1 Tax=Vanilla planifolia TaxID=51239 RepID=A0A835UB80_VANPL|nr:hypothetical protein HPP92_025630 [Vanilla planifolia]
MSWSVGPEFSRSIDSELKWKTSSNCKPRALRRARTFKQESLKKSTMKNMKEIEDIFDRDTKNKGDIMVSKSEKLGVSILGRRFGDSPESFPIKKRFSFLLSQLPSCLSSSSSISDHYHGNHTVIFHNDSDLVQQDKPGGSPSIELDRDQGRNIPTEKRSLDYTHTLQVDVPEDFSGISILAAAASIERELMDAAGQPLLGHPSIESQLLSKISETDSVEENRPSCDPVLRNKKRKTQLVPYSSAEVLVRDPGDGKSDECERGNSFVSVDSSSGKIKMPSSCDGRLHWDLNTDMDAWENLPGKKIDSELNDTFFLNKGGNLNGEYENQESGFVTDEVGRLSTVNHSQCCLGKYEGEKFYEKFEDTNHRGADKKNCLVTADDFLVESIAESVSDMKMVDASKEDKHKADSVSGNMEVCTDNNVPRPVISGHAAVVSTINGNEPIITTDDTQQSVACQLDKDPCGMKVLGVHENTIGLPKIKNSSRSMLHEGCLPDGTVCSIEVNALTCQSTIVAKTEGNSLGNTYVEQLPHSIACVTNHDKNSMDDSNTGCLSSDSSLGSEKATSPIMFCSKYSTLDSEGIMQGTNGIPPVDDTLSSLDLCRTSTDCHLNSPGKDDNYLKCSGQISFEEEFGSGSHPNATPIDADHNTGMEMVEFLGDDDSQYEDGELRESILNIWGEDGAEEVEADHVDYESDGRQTDFNVDECAFKSQTDFAFGVEESKQEGMMAYSHSDENRLLVAGDDSQSKHFQTYYSKQDASNASCWKEDFTIDILKLSKDTVNIGDGIEMDTRGQKRLLAPDGADDVGESPGKSSQQACHRLKSSGWDKMPHADAEVNSLQNFDCGSFAQSVGIETAKGTSVFSSMRRNASSGVQISKFFEASCQKEVSQTRASRNIDTRRSIGRSWLPFHAQGKRRDDSWVGSHDDHGYSLYDKSGCRSAASFAPFCSRNAAAAAIAKVESTGFVVAPDGTVVKAGGLGSSTTLCSHSSKSTAHSHSVRGSSPMEFSGSFGMSCTLCNSREPNSDRGANVGRGRGQRCCYETAIPVHRYRYHSPMANGRIRSESLQHPLSRRERSFSPHRRSIHLSREPVRSPSRYRTRCPHAWASPIGSNDGWIDGVPNTRRQSRSPPNFKSQRKLLRQSSDHCRTVSGEELAGYAPLCSSKSSQVVDSGLIDRKNLEDRHQHRRPSGRSSVNRWLSRSPRLDHVDSRGRMKLDDYYRPLHSERFQLYAGCDNGSKYEGCDGGRRGRSNRYDVLPPEGHFKNNGNVNRLHYDDDSFKVQEAKTMSLRFQHSGFNVEKGVCNGRFREEMRHFGHRRHG